MHLNMNALIYNDNCDVRFVQLAQYFASIFKFSKLNIDVIVQKVYVRSMHIYCSHVQKVPRSILAIKNAKRDEKKSQQKL